MAPLSELSGATAPGAASQTLNIFNHIHPKSHGLIPSAWLKICISEPELSSSTTSWEWHSACTTHVSTALCFCCPHHEGECSALHSFTGALVHMAQASVKTCGTIGVDDLVTASVKQVQTATGHSPVTANSHTWCVNMVTICNNRFPWNMSHQLKAVHACVTRMASGQSQRPLTCSDDPLRRSPWLLAVAETRQQGEFRSFSNLSQISGFNTELISHLSPWEQPTSLNYVMMLCFCLF